MCKINFVSEHRAITAFIKSHDINTQEITLLLALFSIANERMFPEEAMSISFSELELYTAMTTAAIKKALDGLADHGVLVAETERKSHRKTRPVRVKMLYLSVENGAQQGQMSGENRAQQGQTSEFAPSLPQVRPKFAPSSPSTRPLSVGDIGGIYINQTKPNETKPNSCSSSSSACACTREDSTVGGLPEPFITDEEARALQQDHDEVLDAAARAGFRSTDGNRDGLLALYAKYGKAAVLDGIAACVKRDVLNLGFLEGCIRREGKPKAVTQGGKAKPGKVLTTQNYAQRDYADDHAQADGWLLDELNGGDSS